MTKAASARRPPKAHDRHGEAAPEEDVSGVSLSRVPPSPHISV